MTRNKVPPDLSKHWRCSVCDKTTKSSMWRLALHIAMMGNEVSSGDKYEVHKEWRGKHGLKKGYNTRVEANNIAREVLEMINKGKVGIYTG